MPDNNNTTLSGPRMPYSLEAEQAVLGAVLMEPDAISRVAEVLPSSEYFYLANHRAILTVYMQCDVAVTSGGSCDVEAFCTFFEIHTAKFDELAVVDVEDIHIALTR